MATAFSNAATSRTFRSATFAMENFGRTTSTMARPCFFRRSMKRVAVAWSIFASSVPAAAPSVFLPRSSASVRVFRFRNFARSVSSTGRSGIGMIVYFVLVSPFTPRRSIS